MFPFSDFMRRPLPPPPPPLPPLHPLHAPWTWVTFHRPDAPNKSTVDWLMDRMITRIFMARHLSWAQGAFKKAVGLSGKDDTLSTVRNRSTTTLSVILCKRCKSFNINPHTTQVTNMWVANVTIYTQSHITPKSPRPLPPTPHPTQTISPKHAYTQTQTHDKHIHAPANLISTTNEKVVLCLFNRFLVKTKTKQKTVCFPFAAWERRIADNL